MGACGHRKDRPRKRSKNRNRNKRDQFGMRPLTSTEKKQAIEEGCGVCEVCETALGRPGGYADTGMCGPCCTGEAATFSEFGDTW